MWAPTTKKSEIEELKSEEEETAVATVKWWDLGSPLYDSHELASISHLIERHLMMDLSNSVGSSSKRRLSWKFTSDVPLVVVADDSDGGGSSDDLAAVAAKEKKSWVRCCGFGLRKKP
ncbi:hypothetical protein LINPERHAP1_LOCUS20113 [Linum perenne]